MPKTYYLGNVRYFCGYKEIDNLGAWLIHSPQGWLLNLNGPIEYRFTQPFAEGVMRATKNGNRICVDYQGRSFGVNEPVYITAKDARRIILKSAEYLFGWESGFWSQN